MKCWIDALRKDNLDSPKKAQSNITPIISDFKSQVQFWLWKKPQCQRLHKLEYLQGGLFLHWKGNCQPWQSVQVIDEIESCFSVSSNNGFCAWWLSPSGENLLLRRRFLNKMDIFRCDGPREKTRRPLKIMYCCGDARDALERKQDRKSLLQKESIMQHVK